MALIPENQKINWNELLEGYNRIYKAKHKTVKSFLTALYKKQQTLIKVGDILGVSHTVVQNEMKRLGISRLPKGHRGLPKGLRAIKDLGDVSDMTVKEMIDITGYSSLYTYAILRTYKIKYKRII